MLFLYVFVFFLCYVASLIVNKLTLSINYDDDSQVTDASQSFQSHSEDCPDFSLFSSNQLFLAPTLGLLPKSYPTTGVVRRLWFPTFVFLCLIISLPVEMLLTQPRSSDKI